MVKEEKEEREDVAVDNNNVNVKLLRAEKESLLATALSHVTLEMKLEDLLALEKRARLLNEIDIATEAASAIIACCIKHADWKALNAQITLLSKRRGQHRKTLTTVVKDGMAVVNSTPSQEVKLELIDTLRAVSDGKMYLEIERAQLTKILSEIKEKEGDIAAAASILQEVQVETYGSMDKKEKVDFILEQMRLCLLKKDFIRAFIISKKIDPKNLQEEEMETLKLKYYKLMIEYHTHSNDTLALSKCCEAVFNTKCIKNDNAKMQDALSHYILFLSLSVHTEDQKTQLKRILKEEEKKLREMIPYKELLKAFCTREIAAWPLPSSEAYKSHKIFTDKVLYGDMGSKWWALFHKRLLQHNILVASKYYTRISLARLADLNKLSVDDVEAILAEMVVEKILSCKINRPNGLVDFASPSNANAALTKWSNDISELLNILDSTSHLITKEININK